ncbi:MAG: PH domain-containing protein [Lachnospiraceae bacterium]
MQFQERKRWLFFGLPFTFTTYRVTEEYITVKSGLLRQKEDDCYMYKIVDTRLVRSLPERFFGLGTVGVLRGDTTDPVLHLKHIRHSKEIKNFILAASGGTAHEEKDAPDPEYRRPGPRPCAHGCGWRRDSGPSAGASLRSLRRQKIRWFLLKKTGSGFFYFMTGSGVWLAVRLRIRKDGDCPLFSWSSVHVRKRARRAAIKAHNPVG